MKTLEMLQNLKSVSGTNAKLDLFKTYLSQEPLLEQVFNMALSSEIKFGIKKIPDYIPSSIDSSKCYLSLEAGLETAYSVFSTNEETGNERIDHFKLLLEMMHPDDAKVFEMVIQKKLDCGISVTNANKCLAKPIPVFNVMLCSKNEKKTLDKIKLDDMILQTKLDGMRVIISVDNDGLVRYRTRQGKEFDMPEKYNQLFSQFVGAVFDGEAVIRKEGDILDRKTGNGIMNSIRQGKASQEDMNSVVFALWDMVSYDGFFKGCDAVEYKHRYWNMISLSELIDSDNIMFPLTRINVTSNEDINEFYELNRDKGEEGIIIKDGSKPYEAKRVKHQIKMKAEETADLIVLDVEEGTGKNSSKLGALVCETADGLLRVNVGIGFSDEQREAIWNTRSDVVGKVVEVKYNEIIRSRGNDKASLFLPVFVEVRTDKDIANTLAELK
jgi:ATP-dependent DNA ligase